MYFLQQWGQSGPNTDAIFLWINPQENRYEIIPNPISTRKGDNHAALDTAPVSPSSGSIPLPTKAGATLNLMPTQMAVVVALLSTAIVHDIDIAVKSDKKTFPTEPIRQSLSIVEAKNTNEVLNPNHLICVAGKLCARYTRSCF